MNTLQLIKSAQTEAINTVNIGRRIFEEGKDRADYGKQLIMNLSCELEPTFCSGYSIRKLELMRQFYRTFLNTNAVRS